MGLFSGPPQQMADIETIDDIELDSIAFGWLVGFIVLTAVKAGSQTMKAWRRVGRLTVYAIMVWLDIIACAAFGLLCWLCMHGTIRESFAFFFLGTTLRVIIIQLTVQILTNRISILVPNVRLKRVLRWVPLAIVFMLNVGVYCIWIPAHLKETEPWVTINNIYSRCEKAVYMVLDVALNLYFCHLIKSRLINAGIGKYRSLYRFNMTILVLGAGLDVLLIGLMNLSNPIIYVQFYPVIFMGKLNIEMSMADMIAKVAQSSNVDAFRETRQDSGLPPANAAIDFDAKDLSSATSSMNTNSVRETFNITPRTDMRTEVPSNPREHRNELNDTARRRPLHNSLYHAWISGGVTSQAHLAREGPQTSHCDDSLDLEMATQSIYPGEGDDKRKSVITRHTSVHLKTESAGSSMLLMSEKGSEARSGWPV